MLRVAKPTIKYTRNQSRMTLMTSWSMNGLRIYVLVLHQPPHNSHTNVKNLRCQGKQTASKHEGNATNSGSDTSI